MAENDNDAATSQQAGAQSSAAPGWYPTQEGERWWDGQAWGQFRAGAGPVPPAPAGYAPTGNPRADAKAAKAYAKATRPWFKKKRWWLAGAFALLVLIAALSSGGNKDNGPTVVSDSTGASTGTTPSSGATQASQAPTKAAAAKVGTKDNPAKIGQTIALAGTQYTVKSVKTAQTIGDPSMLGAKANGIFIEVTLTIENMKNSTKTFTQDATSVIGGNGASYDPDTNGSTAAMGDGQDSLFLADMQPQLPKTGVIVYDIPPTATKGALLKVSDLFGQGDAYINLGL